MTLQEFKFIYFWEWFHRAFARLIGLIYTVPLITLVYYRKIEKKYLKNVLIIGLLLFVQAIIGWYMVKSGLFNRVDVSQYRLALHLTTAFIILGFIFHTLFTYLLDKKLIPHQSIFSYELSHFFMLLLVFTFLQISYGAFVSGTHSGLLYNTWPLYNGDLLPDLLISQLKNFYTFFENREFIIFIHRTFAVLIFLFLIYLNYKIIVNRSSSKYLSLMIAFNLAFFIQAILGIAMTYLNIPWHLALIHQANSITIFLLVLAMYILSLKSSQEIM